MFTHQDHTDVFTRILLGVYSTMNRLDVAIGRHRRRRPQYAPVLDPIIGNDCTTGDDFGQINDRCAKNIVKYSKTSSPSTNASKASTLPSTSPSSRSSCTAKQQQQCCVRTTRRNSVTLTNSVQSITDHHHHSLHRYLHPPPPSSCRLIHTVVYLLPIILFIHQLSPVACDSSSCPLPSVPLYAEIELNNGASLTPATRIEDGTVASYKCNQGYELFGNIERKCQNGKWIGALPYCAVNVAYGKPTNQSSTAKGGDSRNANDGDMTTLHENKFCTETKMENSPWWQVDLLQPYEIRVIRLLTRSCCGHQPLHDLEIRVGNSSTVQGNRLCAWYPGTLGDGESKDFPCANPIVGRYVYVQMVGIEGSLSLCETLVFTTKEFSANRCGDANINHQQQQITAFNQTCYEFQTSRGGSFSDADGYCKSHGGLLINSITDVSQNFLFYELERYKPKLRSKLLWVGARRDFYHQNRTDNLFGTRPRMFWHWINGSPIGKFLWADDQPNNYNGQQNCIVLDGGRKWLWNDVSCDLDYLPWICQYSPSNCGSPDVNENSTVVSRDYRIGGRADYKCSEGCRIDGLSERQCLSTGFWEGSAPTCSFVDCGPLPTIEHGRVKLQRTTFNASAEYSCDKDYTIVGDQTRFCLGNGSWSGQEPRCFYSHCGAPNEIENGFVSVSNRSINGVASYSCKSGFVLVGGAQQQFCQLGGTWSGLTPHCKFVDCRAPMDIVNGVYRLLNKTTYFGATVSYECDPDFVLVGNRTRVCTEFGLWSHDEPVCEMINCGIPMRSPGVRYSGNSFSVNSELMFDCDSGYKLIDGNTKRICQRDGTWSGKDPTCRFVECGRVQPILKGEIVYVNSTTYLGSELHYSCGTGYRLAGNKVRVCLDDGRWSGSKPKCEEIRCQTPQIPKNSSVSYNGNDRSFADSFKVGSTVQYRCSAGHIVSGQSLRTCETSGRWSDSPPHCVYIDCGLPFPLTNGRWLLSANTTFYGSTVEYECNSNYKLTGPGRRICLENGTWSGQAPTCELVTCVQAQVKDDKTTVQVSSNFVGGQATYSCAHGLELIGNVDRICLDNGEWSGQVPYCRYVDCGRPPVIPNGRGYLVNGTTFFGSIVEYHCLPDFRMISESAQRICQATGEWSGTIPRCLETSEAANEIESSLHNSLSNDAEYSAEESSKSIGIGVSFGIGTILILMIIVGFLFLKVKKQKPIKNTENIEVNHQPNKDSRVMSYSRIALETDFSSGMNALHDAAVQQQLHHHQQHAHQIRGPTNLVTFSAANAVKVQPLYANLPAHQQAHRNGNARLMNGQHPPPPAHYMNTPLPKPPNPPPPPPPH